MFGIKKYIQSEIKNYIENQIKYFESGASESIASTRIKNIIQDHVKQYIEAQFQYMSSNTYDEKGKRVSSCFYFKVEDGHWVNTRANENFDVFSEHIRSQANWETLRKNNIGRESADVDYDQEHLFKNRGNGVFDKDIVKRTDAGILVARK